VRLLIIVTSNDDVRLLLGTLIEAGHRATKLASTGGFLRKGNTTLLMGVEDEDVDEVLHIVRSTCRRRVIHYPFHVGEHPGMVPQEAVEVEVGGAAVFILPVEKFYRF